MRERDTQGDTEREREREREREGEGNRNRDTFILVHLRIITVIKSEQGWLSSNTTQNTFHPQPSKGYTAN